MRALLSRPLPDLQVVMCMLRWVSGSVVVHMYAGAALPVLIQGCSSRRRVCAMTQGRSVSGCEV
jgi:hypothetical protein